MRRGLWMSVAALVVFAAVICARLPARWAVGLLPSYIQCTAPEGSIWNGACAQLALRNVSLGTAQWQIDATALLRAALSGSARLQRTDGQLAGKFEVRPGGHMAARELVGDLPLDPTLMPFFPSNWRGRVHLDVPLLAVQGDRLELLQGVVTVRDILATGPRPDSFGSYELRVQDPPDASGAMRGSLRDLDGPFAVTAQVLLERSGVWEVKGQIAARPGASPAVARQIEILGSPDAAGRRNFALSNRE